LLLIGNYLYLLGLIKLNLMKTFGKIILWILGILILLVLVSYLLPKTYKVERSITMKAKPSVAYGLVSNLNRWEVWSPWNKVYDTTAVFEMQGPDGTIGSIRKWNGELIGEGEMIITDLKNNELLEYELLFEGGKYRSVGKVIILPEGDSLKVSLSDEGDLGYNPMARYMGLFMESMMGPDFEKGLSKLKEICESRNDWPDITLVEMEPVTAYLVRDSAGPETYGSVMGRAYGEIMDIMKRQKIQQAGAPFAIYLTWDSVTMRSTMDIGIPVNTSIPGKGRVRLETIPSQRALKAVYFGPYDKTAPTYYILDQVMLESGLEPAGSPWEIYITDPMSETDTLKWQTDIIFPVK